MNIVAGADDRFAMRMAVTLYSALANMEHGQSVSLYIVDGGISIENRHRLEEVLAVDHVDAHLEWVVPDLLHLTGMKTTQSFSQAAYLRLLIPELLPDVDRAIYLDSDLVVERDLGELSEIEMGDVPALAVRDYMYPSVSCLKSVGDNYQSRCL